jgi:hypothetical protein
VRLLFVATLVVAGTATAVAATSSVDVEPKSVRYPLFGGTQLPCSDPNRAAIAFANADFTAPITPQSNPVLARRLGTDVSGCYDGRIVAVQPDYSGAFDQTAGTCGSYLSFGAWTGRGPGPATLQVSPNASPVPSCTFDIRGDTGTTATVTARVFGGCSAPTCYAIIAITNEAQVRGCDPDATDRCMPLDLGQDVNSEQAYFASTNGGNTWTLVGSCRQSETYAQTADDFLVTTKAVGGCTKDTLSAPVGSSKNGIPPPAAWLPASVDFSYSDFKRFACVALASAVPCGGAGTAAPGAWATPAGPPPGTNGLVFPSAPPPGTSW